MDDNQIAAELRDLADEADTELAQHDLETLADALYTSGEYTVHELWCAPGGIDDSEAEYIELDNGVFSDCVVLPYEERDERTRYTGRRLTNYTESEQIADVYNNRRQSFGADELLYAPRAEDYGVDLGRARHVDPDRRLGRARRGRER